MSQERTFQLQLKNDQTIGLAFTPIAATGDRLWQMFATTEALDMVLQLINQSAQQTSAVTETKSARKTSPNLVSGKVVTKTVAKKQKSK
jgi:hypothetical protein